MLNNRWRSPALLMLLLLGLFVIYSVAAPTPQQGRSGPDTDTNPLNQLLDKKAMEDLVDRIVEAFKGITEDIQKKLTNFVSENIDPIMKEAQKYLIITICIIAAFALLCICCICTNCLLMCSVCQATSAIDRCVLAVAAGGGSAPEGGFQLPTTPRKPKPVKSTSTVKTTSTVKSKANNTHQKNGKQSAYKKPPAMDMENQKWESAFSSDL